MKWILDHRGVVLCNMRAVLRLIDKSFLNRSTRFQSLNEFFCTIMCKQVRSHAACHFTAKSIIAFNFFMFQFHLLIRLWRCIITSLLSPVRFNIMSLFIIFVCFILFMVCRSLLSFVHHHVRCILLRMHSRQGRMLLCDGAFRSRIVVEPVASVRWIETQKNFMTLVSLSQKNCWQ